MLIHYLICDFLANIVKKNQQSFILPIFTTICYFLLSQFGFTGVIVASDTHFLKSKQKSGNFYGIGSY